MVTLEGHTPNQEDLTSLSPCVCLCVSLCVSFGLYVYSTPGVTSACLPLRVGSIWIFQHRPSYIRGCVCIRELTCVLYTVRGKEKVWYGGHMQVSVREERERSWWKRTLGFRPPWVAPQEPVGKRSTRPDVRTRVFWLSNPTDTEKGHYF